MKPGTFLNIAASALIGAGALFATVGTTTTAALMMSSTSASAQNVDRYRPGANRGNRGAKRGNRGVNRGNRGVNRGNRGANRAERRGNRAERRANRSRNHARGGQRFRHPRYDRNRHGRRYRNRRSGFDHFYNGFYYSSPFWLGAAPYYYSYSGSNWDAHVEWCHDRYRSYNERRDAFKGYDGLWHKCNSPYG